MGLGQRFQLVIGRHHVLVAVTFAEAALGIGVGGWKEARSVEVDVGGEDVPGHRIDLLGVGARDMAVAEVLADRGAILGLDQGIVVGLPRPGLGLLDTEFFQQLGDLVINVLGAVVAVKAPDHEREGVL